MVDVPPDLRFTIMITIVIQSIMTTVIIIKRYLYR